LVVKYCTIGIESDRRFAELWAYLGCIAYDRHDEDAAVLYFETALGCLKEVNIGSVSSFYSYVPAKNLFMIYYHKGEFAKALMYNKMLLEADPQDEQALQNRDLTWRQYFNKYPPPAIKAPAGTPPPSPDSTSRERPAGALSVAWLIPHINLDDPATRIRRVNISNKLEQLGLDSSIIHSYHNQSVEHTLKEIRDAKVCVFTQFTDWDLKLMAAVKKAGKKVLLDSCEAVFGIPGQREAWGMADRVVCCSTKLADMHKEKGLNRVAVVQDAAEVGF
jgi:tetratricopeptide (TPR) repeat protein